MGVFDFGEWEDITGKLYRPNYTYGRSNKPVEIFTYREIKNISTRIKMNAEIAKMFDIIEKSFNRPEIPLIMQIMIYKTTCPHCKRSLPIFKRIASELSRRLYNYRYEIYEIGDYIRIMGESIPVMNIYRYFNSRKKGTRVSGVPFFIQNFKVERINLPNRGGYGLVLQRNEGIEHWDVVYSGEIQPFAFLSASFNIPNTYIDKY